MSDRIATDHSGACTRCAHTCGPDFSWRHTTTASVDDATPCDRCEALTALWHKPKRCNAHLIAHQIDDATAPYGAAWRAEDERLRQAHDLLPSRPAPPAPASRDTSWIA